MRKVRVGHDAAGWRAASRPGHHGRVRRQARSGTGSRRGGQSQSRVHGTASAEPHRIRQRHPRSAGAGYRRGHASARRRFERRLRQYRGRVGSLARPGRALRGRRHQDQPDGRRKYADERLHHHIPRAGRSFADGAHRRIAARHARRHSGSPQLSAGCRIRHQSPGPQRRDRRRRDRSEREKNSK